MGSDNEERSPIDSLKLLEDVIILSDEDPDFAREIAPHIAAIAQAYMRRKDPDGKSLEEHRAAQAILGRYNTDSAFRQQIAEDVETAIAKAMTPAS